MSERVDLTRCCEEAQAELRTIPIRMGLVRRSIICILIRQILPV
jgi:hypothetical protein